MRLVRDLMFTRPLFAVNVGGVRVDFRRHSFVARLAVMFDVRDHVGQRGVVKRSPSTAVCHANRPVDLRLR